MTIAAIITTYNSADFLEEALASVFAQTRPPDEVLIIDDGSTDDTPRRMERWAGRVDYRWQKNTGVSVARNVGFRAAKSSWIAYLDADDLWQPDKLEQQEAWSREHPEVEGIFGLGQNFAQAGCEDRFDPVLHHLDRWLPAWLMGSGLVRRDLLERTGGFSENLRTAEIVDWIIRLREAGAVLAMTDIRTFRRRLHGANKRLTEGAHMSVDLRLLRGYIARRRAKQAGTTHTI